MSIKPGVFFLAIVLLLSVFSIRTITPPAVVPADASDTVFSAQRAYDHLLHIAAAPHSPGTGEHSRVLAYISAYCRELGLGTAIQSATAVRSVDKKVIAGKAENVTALLKGRTEGPVVLVMAHYDSQPNAVGAGDDGAGVAAMLETARILRSSAPLNNTILFLFTDGEEDGLLGARAFIRENPLFGRVGMAINFEGRGNSGISMLFEVNPRNGWMVSQYGEAASHPYGNSLNYEIYRRLPNNTDFSVFKEAGVPGLNNAFIEGFANYHSMTDIPANLDRRSLQSHGDNMLALTKYFGNAGLAHTQAPDRTYFNIIPAWFVNYPARWNILFIVICDLLFIFYVVAGIRKGALTALSALASAGIFLVALAATYFITGLFLRMVLGAYPLYTRWYSASPYNSGYYFLAMTALTVALFSLLYQWLSRRMSMQTQLCGMMFVGVLLMNMLGIWAGSASYMLIFPLFFLLSGSLAVLLAGLDERAHPWAAGWIHTASLLPLILLIIPLVYFIFIAFGLGSAAACGTVLLTLSMGFMFPLLHPVLRSRPFALPLLALAVLAGSLIAAHFQSGFTPARPLQVNISYQQNDDDRTARWTSAFTTTDAFSSRFFKGSNARNARTQGLITGAPILPLAPPGLTLVKDTLQADGRCLRLHFQPGRHSTYALIDLPGDNPAQKIVVGNTTVPQDHHGPFYTLEYYGLDETGFEVTLVTAARTALHLTVTEASMGLPASLDYCSYPPGVIPGPGHYSNTTRITKSYTF